MTNPTATNAAAMKRRAILAFMLDRPGVLNKIAMLIRRKMYNVETLTVCKTHQPGNSGMTNHSGISRMTNHSGISRMTNHSGISRMTNHSGISRMTITLREDNDAKMRQMLKQIEKITEVISATELDMDESFWREVAVVKLETDPDRVAALKRDYHLEILDRQNGERFIVQVAGTSQSIDAFIQAVGDDSIVEVARSGFTAIEK
jgi:acetolactate synthase I/III small subunit